jgi:hypothetical protein
MPNTPVRAAAEGMPKTHCTSRVAASADQITADAVRAADRKRRIVDRMAGTVADMFAELHGEEMRLHIDHSRKVILITRQPLSAGKPISVANLKGAV